MDQRVSQIETDNARMVNLAAKEAPGWAPPVAPLAMPKQVLEPASSWVDLADLGRLFLSRRKA